MLLVLFEMWRKKREKMIPLPLIITYLAIGTIWAWFAIKLYYLRFNNKHLMVLISIMLNCLLFPVGLCFRRFFYITIKKDFLGENYFVKEELVTTNFIIEPIIKQVEEEVNKKEEI